MDTTCKNCLNAYNKPYTEYVLCCNKDFDAQSEPNLDVTVMPDESCGRFQQRNRSQAKLRFPQTLF